jgi:hypothetical protein
MIQKPLTTIKVRLAVRLIPRELKSSVALKIASGIQRLSFVALEDFT